MKMDKVASSQNDEFYTPEYAIKPILKYIKMPCTMLSFGECPSAENASHLSQILEASPHPKYSLSAKACLGIVRRAEHRGKELPPLLKAALLNQAGLHSASKETASTEPTPQDATAKDGQRE